MTAIEVRGLRKVYGSTIALESLSLDVPRGSIFGIIGPNGAGKTTLLSVVATLLIPTAGTVRVLGTNPLDDPGSTRKVMGYMPDVMGVNERLTVAEYLEFFARAHRLPRAEWGSTTDSLLELVNLADKKAALVDSLSRGMKQRLSLARALIHQPELLVLDEPASGLDPQARVELRMLLQELQRMGKTIVISSHILAELEEMCSHIAIIVGGKLAAAGETQQLLAATTANGIRIRIVLADGRERVQVVPDLDAQQALLHQLIVEEGLPVVEFTPQRADLERTFMDAIAPQSHPQHGLVSTPGGQN
jgi:ABC-2 type transport system ATP-binding protein